MRGPDPAAAADQLRSLLAPFAREFRVLGAADAAIERPPGFRVVAEVRIDAEGQVGEVPQPGQHSCDVVGRDAVDHQRAHSRLLETARGPAEQIALRAAPVLAENSAEAVAAAPEAKPDREAAGDQALDAAHGDLPDQRHRLEQDEVGRLVVEDAREQLESLEATLVGEISVKAEGHRYLALATGVGDGPACQPDPLAGQLHPISRRDLGQPALPVHHALDPPGVGGDHIAANVDVAAVDLDDRLGRVQQRPHPPVGIVVELEAGNLEFLELGRDPAVEDHALLRGEHGLDPPAGRRALALRAQRRRHQLRVSTSWVKGSLLPRGRSCRSPVRRLTICIQKSSSGT